MAGMKITPLNPATGTAEQTRWFVSAAETLTSKTSMLNLKTGYYNVRFTLEKPGAETLEWLEVLHVYQNMISAYTQIFEDEYFNNISYTVTFVFNDASTADGLQNRTHGDLVNTVTDPVWGGYTFGGWYTVDGNYENENKWDFPARRLSSNLSLYARWYTNLGSADFNVSGNDVVYNSNNRSVTVEYSGSAMNENTAGEITVYYSGTAADGTSYAESETAPVKAGTYDVKVTTEGGSEYAPVTVPVSVGTLTIQRKELTISGVTAVTRAYIPAVVTVALSGGSLAGVEDADTVTFTLGNGTIANANTGSGKAVTTAITLGGADKDNYTLTQPAGIAVTINAAPVASAAVTVTAPATANTPVTTAPAGGTGYTCGTVSWSPAQSPFRGGTQYTATVTLTAAANYTFTGGLTAATINGQTATVVNNGATAALSYQFAATAAATVSGITIRTQPTALTYTHGNTLNLSGLEVTLTYNDGSTVNVPLASFAAYSITTNPANGTSLSCSVNNGQPVAVSCSGRTANTNNLTVNKANPTITTLPTISTATYGQTLSQVGFTGGAASVPGAFTWTTPAASVGAVGTRSFNMTFTPTDTANYNTAAGSVNVTVNPKTVTISGVSAASRDYNGTTTVALTGGTLQGVLADDSVGFALGNGTMANANAGSGKAVSTSIALTGAVAGNYTLTQPSGITVTINKIDPMVTWPTGLTATYGQTLANVALPGNGTSTPMGTFTWTTPATSVGRPGVSAFSMTFTPNDTANYNTLTNNVNIRVLLGMEMVRVNAGSFQMGNGNGGGDVTPVHTVTLSNDFKMGKYQVTQEQYLAVMLGVSAYPIPSVFQSNPAAGEIQDKRSVERVNWYEAIVFCNMLSIAEGLTPAYSMSGRTDPRTWGSIPSSSNAVWDAVVIVSGATGYRLPTEAQWEYTAKGGQLSQGYIYSGSNDANEVAWYSGKTGTPTGSMTHEVGKLAANELGICDMSGNVWEWCWDWYGTYPSTAETDPTVPGSPGASPELDPQNLVTML